MQTKKNLRERIIITYEPFIGLPRYKALMEIGMTGLKYGYAYGINPEKAARNLLKRLVKLPISQKIESYCLERRYLEMPAIKIAKDFLSKYFADSKALLKNAIITATVLPGRKSEVKVSFTFDCKNMIWQDTWIYIVHVDFTAKPQVRLKSKKKL